ncbi:WD repeat-containing and planar cell polarity effector protein fritz homolog [Pollicipes pollicipes]|uniref:WD repeat-containing and planar cell polarity effector protein fritz homolog n=1 Tax=Pollicipes pollicipes TaxID=41117 RepID=UPI001884E2B4|nr:WD repeat-containing and planar cell polarity effector protein fritz homolog [Pollicipes pollicipes]
MMASLLMEAHFWTHSEDVIVHPDDVGAFKFHDKTESSGVKSTHQRIKESYADARGITTRLANKRRTRDRDSFKQLEELLDTQKLSYQSWHHLNLLLLLFESGTLVTLWVNFQTGNVDRLLIDKTLVGKMGSDQVVSAVLTELFMLLTHPENRITLLALQRPVCWERWGRLSVLEPRATVAQQVAVWWSAAVGEIQPWTPSGRDQDRANVLVYGVSTGPPSSPAADTGQASPDGTRLELLSYCKTHHDPLLVQFSHLRPDTLYTVEQSLTNTDEVLVEHSTYDISSATCQQLTAITIPLTSEVLCAALSPDERRLLLGCADNSLLLHNCARQMTHMVQIQMTPCRAAWHPHSTLAFVSSETGQLRCYDLALSQLPLQLLGHGHAAASTATWTPAVTPASAAVQGPRTGLGLGQYFRFKPRVSRLLHCPEVMSQEGHVLQSLLVTFVRGPMALLCLQVSRPNKGRVHPSDVISDYVSERRLDAAINLLASLNWEQQGDEALAGLYMIANHLLKLPLTPAREAQLEAALGSYLAPVRALTRPVENMYGDRVRNITRRFFHHLLRHQCFEKAYRLALDLRDHDLFMDLQRAALRAGDPHLAAAALAKADELDNASSVTSGSESGDTSSCSSDCSSSWHSERDERSDERSDEPRGQPPDRQEDEETLVSTAGLVVNRPACPPMACGAAGEAALGNKAAAL